MKFSYILKFLLVVIISNVYSNLLKRVSVSNERRKKEKTKAQVKSKTNDGSGSWDSGYTCPSVSLTYTEGGASKLDYISNVMFKPTLLTTKSGDSLLGWAWEITSCSNGAFAQTMVKGSDGKCYFPYRFMKGDAAYTNPVGSNKYIRTTLTNDNNVAYTLTVYLPYKSIGYYINDSQGNQIASDLNNNANNATATVRGEKTTIVNAASSYQTMSGLIANAQQSVDQQKSSIQANLTTAQTNLQTANTTLQTQQQQLVGLQQQVATLQGQIQTTQSSIDGYNSQISSLQKQLDTLNAGTTDAQQTLQSNQATQATAKTTLQSGIQALEGNAPTQKTNLDTAQTDILGLTNYNAGITLVNNVAPRS